MPGLVVIDCFPSSLTRYREGWTVVAVDVLRATTTAVTAVVTGRTCHPVPTLSAAWQTAARLREPLLVGEVGGHLPAGFDENNSPVALSARTDVERPVVLLSTSGTALLADPAPREAVYAACLRNVTSQVGHLAARKLKVAVVGAGARGEFREEDQLGCAWIAAGLVDAGYRTDERSAAVIRKWRTAPADAFMGSHSVGYLMRSGQLADLEFVLEHVDDVDAVFPMVDDRLGMVGRGASRPVAEEQGAARVIAGGAP